MMSTRIKISPETLVWATERRGYTTDSLFDVYPKALDWIREESLPTVNQLESFAKKIHVPFGFLFLKKPPTEKIPITFYRSNGVIVESPPLEIKDLVNSIKSKQEWLRDYFVDNNYESLSFVGDLKDFSKIKVEEGAEIIRRALSINKKWFKETNKSGVFRYWIDKIESNRVFIISTGFVKNNKRPIDVEVCKGFTLVDDMCPFIYINTNNLGGGRIFTLIHELVHVFVGNSIGVSYEPIHPSSQPLENFCDQIASELLVPKRDFELIWNSIFGSFTEKFTRIANIFHISKLVIAKKALDSKYIELADFWNFYNQYTKTPYSKSKTGNYWNSKPYEVSRKFFSFVDIALNQGKILPSNAYRLTNMKSKTYDNFKKNS